MAAAAAALQRAAAEAVEDRFDRELLSWRVHVPYRFASVVAAVGAADGGGEAALRLLPLAEPTAAPAAGTGGAAAMDDDDDDEEGGGAAAATPAAKRQKTTTKAADGRQQRLPDPVISRAGSPPPDSAAASASSNAALNAQIAKLRHHHPTTTTTGTAAAAAAANDPKCVSFPGGVNQYREVFETLLWANARAELLTHFSKAVHGACRASARGHGFGVEGKSGKKGGGGAADDAEGDVGARAVLASRVMFYEAGWHEAPPAVPEPDLHVPHTAATPMPSAAAAAAPAASLFCNLQLTDKQHTPSYARARAEADAAGAKPDYVTEEDVVRKVKRSTKAVGGVAYATAANARAKASAGAAIAAAAAASSGVAQADTPMVMANNNATADSVVDAQLWDQHEMVVLIPKAPAAAGGAAAASGAAAGTPPPPPPALFAVVRRMDTITEGAVVGGSTAGAAGGRNGHGAGGGGGPDTRVSCVVRLLASAIPALYKPLFAQKRSGVTLTSVPTQFLVLSAGTALTHFRQFVALQKIARSPVLGVLLNVAVPCPAVVAPPAAAPAPAPAAAAAGAVRLPPPATGAATGGGAAAAASKPAAAPAAAPTATAKPAAAAPAAAAAKPGTAAAAAAAAAAGSAVGVKRPAPVKKALPPMAVLRAAAKATAPPRPSATAAAAAAAAVAPAAVQVPGAAAVAAAPAAAATAPPKSAPRGRPPSAVDSSSSSSDSDSSDSDDSDDEPLGAAAARKRLKGPGGAPVPAAKAVVAATAAAASAKPGPIAIPPPPAGAATAAVRGGTASSPAVRPAAVVTPKRYELPKPKEVKESVWARDLPALFRQRLERELNTAQLEAVKLAVTHQDFSLLQGPPGTGKTSTVVALLCALALRHGLAYNRAYRVLVCAPSNTAIDELITRVASDAELYLPKDDTARQQQAQAAQAAAGTGAAALDDSPVTVEDLLRKCVRVGRTDKMRDHSAVADMNIEEKTNNYMFPNKTSGGDGKRVDWVMRKTEVMQQLHHARDDLAHQAELERCNIMLSSVHTDRNGPKRMQIRSSLLKQAQFVFATLTGAGLPSLDGIDFDCVVVDEAAQCVEASALCALARLNSHSRHVVLVGDPRQLSATVFLPDDPEDDGVVSAGVVPAPSPASASAAPAAAAASSSSAATNKKTTGAAASAPAPAPPPLLAKKLFERSLFERLEQQWLAPGAVDAKTGAPLKAGLPVHMLTVQYRMAPAIRALPSKLFYGDRLVDAPFLQLPPPPGITEPPPYMRSFLSHGAFPTYRFWDVSSQERRDDGGGGVSYHNVCEGVFVVHGLVQTLLQRFGPHSKYAKQTQPPGSAPLDVVDPREIVIITPYNGQIKLLRRLLRDIDMGHLIRVTTADSAQGQEAPIVIASLVRAHSFERTSIEFAKQAMAAEAQKQQLQQQQQQQQAAAVTGSGTAVTVADAAVVPAVAELPKQNIGFVKDPKRMTVMITRPKHALWIVGDGLALRSSPEWSALMDDAFYRTEACMAPHPDTAALLEAAAAAAATTTAIPSAAPSSPAAAAGGGAAAPASAAGAAAAPQPPPPVYTSPPTHVYITTAFEPVAGASSGSGPKSEAKLAELYRAQIQALATCGVKPSAASAPLSPPQRSANAGGGGVRGGSGYARGGGTSYRGGRGGGGGGGGGGSSHHRRDFREDRDRERSDRNRDRDGTGGGGGSRSMMTCFKCGEKGHKAAQCRGSGRDVRDVRDRRRDNDDDDRRGDDRRRDVRDNHRDDDRQRHHRDDDHRRRRDQRDRQQRGDDDDARRDSDRRGGGGGGRRDDRRGGEDRRRDDDDDDHRRRDRDDRRSARDKERERRPAAAAAAAAATPAAVPAAAAAAAATAPAAAAAVTAAPKASS